MKMQCLLSLRRWARIFSQMSISCLFYNYILWVSSSILIHISILFAWLWIYFACLCHNTISFHIAAWSMLNEKWIIWTRIIKRRRFWTDLDNSEALMLVWGKKYKWNAWYVFSSRRWIRTTTMRKIRRRKVRKWRRSRRKCVIHPWSIIQRKKKIHKLCKKMMDCISHSYELNWHVEKKNEYAGTNGTKAG